MLNDIRDNLGQYVDVKEKECGIRLISNDIIEDTDLREYIRS